MLLKQDYVSGIFVNDRLGRIPGTLPMSAVGLIGSAKTPQPVDLCQFPFVLHGLCRSVDVHGRDRRYRAEDRPGHAWQLQPGRDPQFHGGHRTGFQSRLRDAAPISNADIAPTLAHLAGIRLPSKGRLRGRVLTEALKGGKPVTATRRTLRSDPGPGGLVDGAA